MVRCTPTNTDVSRAAAGHIDNACSSLAKLCTCLLFILNPGFAAAQDLGFTLDFETGDLRGWTVTGGAFEFQPTLDDNPTARDRGQRSNHQGRYWIGTFERYQGRAGQSPGETQEDEPQGSMISADFECPGGTLSFLIGGGSQRETAVELYLEVVNGRRPVRSVSGSNNETMRRVTWDIEQYAGRPMYIRIVDASSSGWGHINVDDFRFSALADDFVEVPRLRGLELEQASRRISRADLAVGSVSYMDGGDRPDIVIRHAPGEGAMVPRGAPVALYVTKGPPEPEMVSVPNLIGLTETLAQREIGGSELITGTITTAENERPAGIVIEQDPRRSAEVPIGSAVDLVLSSGPPARRVKVPDVIGKPERNAHAEINAFELRTGQVTTAESDDPEGIVIDQNPRAPAEVLIGSVVDLVVSSGPPQPERVQVPNVIGQSERAALTVIGNGPFTIGQVTTTESDRAEGIVIDQEPRAPAVVSIGSSIDLVISEGSADEPVRVPDLVGRSLADARAAIRNAGLATGSISREISSKRPDTVISQDPVSGTMVARHSSVDLGVASLAVWLGAGSVALLAAGLVTYRMWPPRGALRIPGMQTELHVDPGRAEPGVGDEPISMDLCARFTADAGVQTVDAVTDVIESERIYDEND